MTTKPKYIRSKIIKNNKVEVIKQIGTPSLYKNFKKLYPRIKHIKYVPKYTFINDKDNQILVPYCGLTLFKSNLDPEIKKIIKLQIIDFIQQLFIVKIAHRDFHTNNICWDGSQIWVIDWEFIKENNISDIKDHWDLTKLGVTFINLRNWGLPVFDKRKPSVYNWLKPIDLKIEEFEIR